MTRTTVVVSLLLGLVWGGCGRRRAPNELAPEQIISNNPLQSSQMSVPPAPPPAPAGPGEPSSPDPTGGNFTLDQALEGLAGSGAPRVVIHTDLGNVTCKLLPQKAPKLVANFVGLARGKRPFWRPARNAWVREPFYNGLTFHRVIPNFMIQGGDPSGNGTGGPGYNVAYEAEAEAPFDRAGLLAPAKRGSQRQFVSGSQFFVTDGAAPHLNGQFPIFGTCEPVAIVANIARVPQAATRPLTAVRITRIDVSREGAPASAPASAPAKAP